MSNAMVVPGSRLLDEVDVVGDAAGLASPDGDEDAVVEPRQFGGGRLDGDRGAEGVLGGVDVLAGGEAGEHLWLAMAHTVGLDVEQRPAVGPEGVADVGDRAAAWAQDLPVGAAGRQQLGIEVAAFCVSAGEGDDAAVTLRGVAEVDGGVDGGVEAGDGAGV